MLLVKSSYKKSMARYECDSKYFALPDSLSSLCSKVHSCFMTEGLSVDIMNNVAEKLQIFGKAGIESALADILHDEQLLSKIASSSYMQGNGFYKLLLVDMEYFKIRLHIWAPELTAQEDLHDHRWYIASTILTGKLESEIWQDSISNNAGFYDEYIYEGKNANPTFLGKVKVELVKTLVHKAGDAYILQPHVLHKIISQGNVLTSTLMCRPSSSRMSARIISFNGKTSNVIPQYMSPDYLYQVIQRYLLSTRLNH